MLRKKEMFDLIERRDSLNEVFFHRFLKSPVFADVMFAKHGYVPGGLMLCAYIEDERIVVRQVFSGAGKYTSFDDFDYYEYDRPEERDDATVREFSGECMRFLQEYDEELYEVAKPFYVAE